MERSRQGDCQGPGGPTEPRPAATHGAGGVPDILPIGARGQFRGLSCRCIGMVERSVTVEDEEHRWQQYLLETPGGPRWLVHDSGHWLWVEPVEATSVQRDGVGRVRHAGRSYRRFQAALATVRSVAGASAEHARPGDRAWIEEYVAPPHVLGREWTARGTTWSLGTWLAPGTVVEAFGLDTPTPEPQAVHPAQPNPYEARQKPALYVSMALVGLTLLAFSAAGLVSCRGEGGDEVLLRQPLHLRPEPSPTVVRAADGSPRRARPPGRPFGVPATEAAVTSGPGMSFEVPALRPGLRLRLEVDDARHAWVGSWVTLLEEKGGEDTEGRALGLEVDGWGREEPRGSTVRKTWSLPAGTYRALVLTWWAADPERPSLGPPRVTLTIGAIPPAPPDAGCCMCFLILAVVPFFLNVSAASDFEKKRWAQSFFETPPAGLFSDGDDPEADLGEGR